MGILNTVHQLKLILKGKKYQQFLTFANLCFSLQNIFTNCHHGYSNPMKAKSRVSQSLEHYLQPIRVPLKYLSTPGDTFVKPCIRHNYYTCHMVEVLKPMYPY